MVSAFGMVSAFTTGAQKFSVSLPQGVGDPTQQEFTLSIAGDGYAYLPYAIRDGNDYPNEHGHLRLLRVDTNGGSSDIGLFDWAGGGGDVISGDAPVITNADQGVLVTWAVHLQAGGTAFGMATVAGASVSIANGMLLPGQIGAVQPVLQAQDGSFVGQVQTPSGFSMIAFDQTGTVRWTVADDDPQIATADGGVIGQSGTIYDSTGNPTGSTDSVIQSWTGKSYRIGSVEQIAANPILFGASWWAFAGGNASGNGSASFPIDSGTNNLVKNKILFHQFWQTFQGTPCRVVFSIPTAIPTYSQRNVEKKLERTNFYDLSIPAFRNLKVRTVTAGDDLDSRTLADYLGNTNGATAGLGFGNHSVVLLPGAFFDLNANPNPRYVLIHEFVLHAYGGLIDPTLFGVFQGQGLWRPPNSEATDNATKWIGTNCNCTPGRQDAPPCTPNTATWGKIDP